LLTSSTTDDGRDDDLDVDERSMCTVVVGCWEFQILPPSTTDDRRDDDLDVDADESE
jgi:hypothetical protein